MVLQCYDVPSLKDVTLEVTPSYVVQVSGWQGNHRDASKNPNISQLFAEKRNCTNVKT